MEKITEKHLLEKSSPKTNKLEQIKNLNLSRLGLKLQDLPVRLLARLRSLERWNLSGNRLQELPHNLDLPALQYLDLSDNQMEDVTSLEPLQSLEELKMDDNLYITVSDHYKLMVLLPNLRIFNGKDVTTTANHLRYVYADNLRTRIIAVWEKSFSLPDPVTTEKMMLLERDFVSAARQHVKFGPSSVSDFTKWRVNFQCERFGSPDSFINVSFGSQVEILAREFFRSLTEPKEVREKESTTTKENPMVSTRKKTSSASISNINLSPLKKPRTHLPESPARESPRKTGLCLRPQTLTQTSEVRMSPRKTSQPPSSRRRRAEPSSRGSAVCQTKEGGAKDKEEVLPVTKSCRKTQVRLKPIHVLQCHSKQDSSDDFSTQLWSCAFQPPQPSGGRTGLVATCGGDSLCVIDCESGVVMKKYKVPGEEFFSLAWSSVLMSTGTQVSAKSCSILAAGGKRGVVKLIHPRNNVAYGEFRASRKSLSVLRFSEQRGNFLYTGSYDNRIVMWDIGGLDTHYNFKVNQLIVMETNSTPLHISLPLPSPTSSPLLSGCDDGLFCFNTQLGSNNTKSRCMDMEITFPVYKHEDRDHDYHTIDGLSRLTDDVIASKNFLHNSIYLWSWSQTVTQKPDKKNRTVSAVVLAELQWTSTEIPYLSLSTCPAQTYIVCGDDKGRLWTYDLIHLHNNFLCDKPVQPTEVLDWPGPIRKGVGPMEGPSINSVTMDPELRFLVALSDQNMVIIWKRDDDRDGSS